MRIQNTLILITGAASGLGEATARHLHSLGGKLVLLDQHTAVHTLAKELNAQAYELDITDETRAQETLEKLASTEVPRVLINCAGIAPAKRMVGQQGAMPQSEFEHVIDVNVFGTFNIMRLLAEKMSHLDVLSDQQRGVIINTSSIAAFEGQAGQTAYAASKAAIAGLTLPAARDLSKFGIRVMGIAPGVMETPMMAAMPEKVRQQLEVVIPFPKRLGFPKEFAQLVQHIIENDYLNGEVIRLDGALRMQ